MEDVTSTNQVYERIVGLLNSNGVAYRDVEHEPEGETVKVSQIRGNLLSQAAKAMVIQVNLTKKDRLYYLTVIPGDRRLNFEKIKAMHQAQRVLLAPRERAELLTACEMGSVPPFSFHEQLTLLVDPAMFDHEEIVFNAGRLDRSIYLGTEAYRNLTQPKIAEITTQAETLSLQEEAR